MALLMFPAFLNIPLNEIGVFIQVGGWIGMCPTLLLVVLTAVAGTAQLRRHCTYRAVRAHTSVAFGH